VLVAEEEEEVVEAVVEEEAVGVAILLRESR
jgi:hypothetical protein